MQIYYMFSQLGRKKKGKKKTGATREKTLNPIYSPN